MAASSTPEPSSLLDENRILRQRILELEAQLERQSSGRFDRAIDVMPLGMAVFDRDFRFLAVTLSLAPVHGLAPEDHLGRGVDVVLTPPLADLTRRSVR